MLNNNSSPGISRRNQNSRRESNPITIYLCTRQAEFKAILCALLLPFKIKPVKFNITKPIPKNFLLKENNLEV